LVGRIFSPRVRILLGFVLLVLYLAPLGQAGSGIHERQVSRGGHPMTLLMPDPRWQTERHAQEHTEEEADALLSHPGDTIPGIIVVHGYASSRQLMLGYGYTLAHAGYAVVMIDLPGHGANPAPFDSNANVAAIEQAYEMMRAQPEIDIARIGLLGHSMGAGAVVQAAVANPERYGATIAISPVATQVTPVTPRNLQLQAGSWEPRFLAAARGMLVAGGGDNVDFGNGRARGLIEIPSAEHISIVFRSASHQAARDWFGQAFEFVAAGSHDHRDWRVLGWLLHVLGWMLVASAVAAPPTREPSREIDLIRRPLHWVGLFLAPLFGTATLALLSRFISVGTLGGIAVGGTLAFWFLVSGTLYLVVAYRAGLPDMADIVRGIGLFVFLSVALGITAHLAWANWSPTTARLVRWPLFALACVPWFVATEIGQGDPRSIPRAAWWAAQSLAAVAGLYLMARFVPGTGVVALMLPLLPAYFAVFVFMGSKVRRPWAYGIGCGLFLGWFLAVAFPMLG
jgi:pimeloyl-ACP methyl ester carboxylesterase